MKRYGRSGMGTASVFLHIWPYPIRFYVEPRIISNRFIHERQISLFLSKIKGEVFVDVGAYLGHYSLMLRSNFDRIFAFEPFPMNLKLLRQNVYYGKAKNVLCVGMAISDKEGTTTLYSSFGGVSGGHSILASETLPDRIKVKTCTLAMFFKEMPKIDLVKVDVEGAEWMVLKGAEPILDKIIAWIVELHDLQKRKELERWFASRGYGCKWLDFWQSSPNHIYAFREPFGANNEKNGVMFVIDSKITLTEAPPSRFIYIAKSLQKKNLKVQIIGKKGEWIEGLKAYQVSGSKHVSRLKILLHTYAKTLGCSYDTLIVRGGLLAFFLLPLEICGKKLILDFHGWLFREIEFFYEKTLYNKLKVAFYYIVERMTVAHSNTIICVSKGTQNALEQKERTKSIVLENGVDLNETKKAIYEAEKEKEKIYSTYHIPKEKPLIGFLGNWERQLDMETMFKGAELAEANMLAIGEGPKLDEYRKRWNNAKFLGKLPKLEALKLIHLCDATIAPYKKAYTTTSYWSQRKVKDYLSLGKPIIMTDVKERETYLIPNKNVLLYEAGNAQDLAEKIRIIVSDKKLAEEMRQNNLKLARQFDWQILVEKSGLIEKILN